MTEATEWEKEIIKKVMDGFAKLKAVPNMVAIQLKNGKTALLPIPEPEMHQMVREQVAARKREIVELALIANAYETELTEEQFKKHESPKGAPKCETIMIMFETRTSIQIRRFMVEGKIRKKLVEKEAASGNNIRAPFTFGLMEPKMPDLGSMYR
jgi:hypothetical protein